MSFVHSASLVPRLEVLASAFSTNDELRGRAIGSTGAWPDLSVVVTENQSAGNGRMGRSWVAPPGSSLAISLLLRAEHPGVTLRAEALAWVPLMAGLAMTRAATFLGVDPRLKWPNDVLVAGKKLSGILCEMLPGGSGVIVGVGVNVSMRAHELPVDTATSLALEGAYVQPDTVLAAFLAEFISLYRNFGVCGGDPEQSGLRDAVVAACDTLGRAVRVHLPQGSDLIGTAVTIDENGRLVVETDRGLTALAAGDVTHLRY